MLSESSAKQLCESVGGIYLAESAEVLRQRAADALDRLLPNLESSQKRVLSKLIEQGIDQSLIWPPLPEEFRSNDVLSLFWSHLAQAKLRLDLSPDTPRWLPDGRATLTPREREVLHHVGLGQTDALIARALGISPRTVGKHVENILRKLEVETRTAAIGVFYSSRDAACFGREGLLSRKRLARPVLARPKKRARSGVSA